MPDHDELMSAIADLSDFVMQNSRIDHHAVSKVLHEHGYREVKHGTRFFRAIYHESPKEGTLRKAAAALRKNPRFDLKPGGESFCDSLFGAFNYVGSSIHISQYDGRTWPTHRPTTKAETVSSFWVVYEVEVSPENILWSMEGLRKLAPHLNERYRKVIKYFDSHYGYQDEIIIESMDAKIIDVHLYDSTMDEEEYNR